MKRLSIVPLSLCLLLLSASWAAAGPAMVSVHVQNDLDIPLRIFSESPARKLYIDAPAHDFGIVGYDSAPASTPVTEEYFFTILTDETHVVAKYSVRVTIIRDQEKYKVNDCQLVKVKGGSQFTVKVTEQPHPTPYAFQYDSVVTISK